MAVQNQDQKFFEIIKPGTNYEFIGRHEVLDRSVHRADGDHGRHASLNAYVIKSRGHLLNWGVDFRGGSEILIEFSRPVDAGDDAQDAGGERLPRRRRRQVRGPDRAEEVELPGARGRRVGRVRAAGQADPRVAGQGRRRARSKRFEWSEGGDKIYLRYDRPVEPSVLGNSLKAIGVNTTQVQGFGRADDNTYEVTLVGLDSEIRRGTSTRKLGAGAVSAIPKVESVGAKAGKQLKADGVKSLLYAILLIMVYIAFRFDLRYGPGTVVALLHDAVITIGAFAVTYKEFSLTTVAAVLTIIGFSMNDTIVVFDRIRENAARLRDRRFDRVVNQSINETLSRTILTSATVFFVTLAMNIFGVGVIRDFAFAMNVGVIVGTYSSIFIASPILIWLNDKYTATQRKQQSRQRAAAAARRRRARRAVERSALAQVHAAAEISTGAAVIASACERIAWHAPSIDESKAAALATAMRIRPLTARLLVARGIVEADLAARFLAPRLADLRPPDGMADLPRARRAADGGARGAARRSACSATTTSTASPRPPS